MSQKNTSVTADAGLGPKQALALESLLSGASITAAASSAGVGRSTLHRWLREDWKFQAAYNGAQRDLRTEIDNRMMQIAHAACETVATAIEQGDVRAALALLKGIGALSGTPLPIGVEDPEELEEEAYVAARERASDRTERSLTPF